MKIEIKNTSGVKIFEFEKENNTIKDTVMEAIRSGVDLSYANLSHADLSYTDLSYNDLRYVDLSYANLSHTNLRYTDLSYTDLSYTDLRYTDLRYANRIETLMPIYCKCGVSIVDDKIKIGYESKSIQEWEKFFKSNEIYDTPRNSKEFVKIEAMFLAYKTYIEHINKYK